MQIIVKPLIVCWLRPILPRNKKWNAESESGNGEEITGKMNTKKERGMRKERNRKQKKKVETTQFGV
jgi:hypothetical protein